MISRSEVLEDRARGLATGQRWNGDGGAFRVITKMVSVTDKSEPWLLICHLNEGGKVIEGSNIEFRGWIERRHAVLVRKA